MTDQKPTGVFVRLPLTGEQLSKFQNFRNRGCEADTVMCAIGTPVTRRELKPIGIVAGHFSDGQPMVRILDYPHLPYGTEIALYCDAQAQIAARDAEILRLREENIHQRTQILELRNADRRIRLAAERICSDRAMSEILKSRIALRHALKGGAA